MQFSDQGIGATLSPLINNTLQTRERAFKISPNETLMGFADFSGEHKKALYETYSFFYCGQSALELWSKWQQEFRETGSLKRRKMSYKALNDQKRWEVLDRYLTVTSEVPGIVFNVALPKRAPSIFDTTQHFGMNSPFKCWKKKTALKVAKVIAFGAYLTAGLCNKSQNIMLFFDNDSIMDNLEQQFQATELMGSQILAHANKNLGHFKMGTAKSDDGSLMLEDLLAIPDLAAGAFQEILSNLRLTNANGKLVVAQHNNLIPNQKSKMIGAWLTNNEQNLIVINILIVPSVNGSFHTLLLNEELKLILGSPY